MIYTLENGLRIVCAPSTSEVVYCGVAIDAGTRDEMDTESGIAHFTEHMTFKGTLSRTARQIISRMESVGGDLNAYTGKEETVYYCTFLRQHLARAIDLLLDIIFCSQYPQEEMDKEVEVVIDEIESYNDQPNELIYDEFEELIFAGHPLGRNILGQADILRRMRSRNIKAYTQRLYRPSSMVLYLHGNVQPEEVLRLAEKSLQGLQLPATAHAADNPRLTPPAPRIFDGEVIRRKHDTHQSHVMIGTRGFGGNDPRHLHLYLLSNMLGGPAMSSRLNLSLRERNGLVYTVESSNVCYSDSGVWSTYFGCDPHDVKRCCRLVRQELRRLTDAPLSQRTLDAVRRQLKGQIGISYDNGENVALGMAKRALHYNNTQSMEELFARLDALTPQQLWDTAQEVFAPEKLLTLVYE